jgi:hypothetical protein
MGSWVNRWMERVLKGYSGEGVSNQGLGSSGVFLWKLGGYSGEGGGGQQSEIWE